MINSTSHRFIASASSVAMSLTMLVAAGAMAQDAAPGDAVVAVETPRTGSASPTAIPLQARIIDVSGKARWRASADSEWKEASVNDDLSPGAEIRTGMRSRVTLRFRNATVLVDSSTNFSIPTIEQEGDVLRTIAAVRSGRADFKVDKVGLENDFKVVTPSTTLAVRGTSFSTITGPLKGVEIVGARENAMRAIEVRYAALNQTVEMSGGAQAKSTSETPSPTENAFGNTFNAPQAGMIASKEEAQQGAYSGSSAPQTQRQATTTVAGVNQVKQDIEAVARGESGSGSLGLLIDISRAASARAETEKRRNGMLPHLAEAVAAASTARARYLDAERAAADYSTARTNATLAIADALASVNAARGAVDESLASSGEVRTIGEGAFRLFASAGPGATDAALRAQVELAREQLALSASLLVPASSGLGAAQASLDTASAESATLLPFADAFYRAYDALDLLSQAFLLPETPITRMEEINALVQQAHQVVLAIGSTRDHPLVSDAVRQSALAVADALDLLSRAGSERDETSRLAGEALILAQGVARDAMLAEIQQASGLASQTEQLLANAQLASTGAGQHLSNLDLAIEGMIVARNGEDEARSAALAAESFSEFAKSRSLAAAAQAEIGAAARALVDARSVDVLRELNVALDALAQTRVHGAATTSFAQAVYDALGQQVPDNEAASQAAQDALREAGLAHGQSVVATTAAGAADDAATQAAEAIGTDSFRDSEVAFSTLLAPVPQALSDAVIAAGISNDAAGHSASGANVASSAGSAFGGQDALEAVQVAEQLAALAASYARDADLAVIAAGISNDAAGHSASGASVASSAGSAFGGQDALEAVQVAEQLAALAASYARDADLAVIAAQAAYQGAMAAGRSAAEVTVWAAAVSLAGEARVRADEAMAAALEARKVAGVAMGEALAASDALGGPGTVASTLAARDAAGVAGTSGGAGASEVLAFAQRHMALLQASVSQINEAMQVLGGTLAATEVTQQSASGVVGRVASVSQALSQFIAIADAPGGASSQQVSGILAALLQARNESLALALAAGTGAADAGASIASHASALANAAELSAQQRAAAIEAILQQTASTLGLSVNDPRLQLIVALSASASGWALQSAANAVGAAGSADAAALSQAAAREQLLALGISPTWGIGDADILYGSDLASAVAAAAQAAGDAAQASFGASVLVSIEGAARATATSTDASGNSEQASLLAIGKAQQAAALWQQAVGELNVSGSARAQATSQIAAIRGEISQIRGKASSSVNAASSGLNGLLAMLDHGSVDQDAAAQLLASIGTATSAARERADEAVAVSQGVTSVVDAFMDALAGVGMGAQQARELMDQVNLQHVPAADAWRAIAAANLDALAPYVQQVLDAAAAGQDVSVDQLAVAALWMQERASQDLARATAARDDVTGALAGAGTALSGYNAAAAAAAGDVIAAAEAALADANAFLQQVLVLQREQSIGSKAVDATGSNALAQGVLLAVNARALQVIDTVQRVSGDVSQYEAAVSAMSSAVSVAQGRRAAAESRLVDLEDDRGSADARLSALHASLMANDRSGASGDVTALSGLAASASSAAADADELRALALAALASIGSLGDTATAAAAGLAGAQGEVSAHQMALSGQLELAESVLGSAEAARSGVEELVADAGTARADALGTHALVQSGQALQRASAALEQIFLSGSELAQLQMALGAASGNQHGQLSDAAVMIRDWAFALDFGTSSIPLEIAAQVAAMHGVGQGAVGAYDSRAAALAGRSGAEFARDVAIGASGASEAALESHQSALIGVNQEFTTAQVQRGVAETEYGIATDRRNDAATRLAQTYFFADASDAGSAALWAGLTWESATLAGEASDRAGGAATLAEEASGRAAEWAQVSFTAFQDGSAAAALAEQQRDEAVGHAASVIASAGAAQSFADAATQFAAIAATAAAADASAFARTARDQAVAQIVLAESARDAAQAAASNARNRATQIVYSAVAAKAADTAQLAMQARDFATLALGQAQAAQADAGTAVNVASQVGGGSN